MFILGGGGKAWASTSSLTLSSKLIAIDGSHISAEPSLAFAAGGGGGGGGRGGSCGGSCRGGSRSPKPQTPSSKGRGRLPSTPVFSQPMRRKPNGLARRGPAWEIRVIPCTPSRFRMKELGFQRFRAVRLCQESAMTRADEPDEEKLIESRQQQEARTRADSTDVP